MKISLMLSKLMLILLLSLAVLPCCCAAERSAVLVIVDGLGSSYIYPDRSPACIDGSLLGGARLQVLDDANIRYELWVPAPETESGNAVIVTGYSGASEEAVTYYGATIYDALRPEGYLSIAILETGDTAQMITKPDIVACERNNSAYDPEVAIVMNSQSVPPGIRDVLSNNPPVHVARGYDPVATYRQYDNWSLGRAIEVVRYMDQTCPGQPYLLVVTVAGTDMAAHEKGYDAYRKTIEGLDTSLSSLANVCRDAGAVMVITADHGMGFKSSSSKGTHASGAASLRNESRLVPLLIFPGEKRDATGIYGQQCLAPTLLSLMECPDTLSIRDGEPIPVSDHPSLYLVSDGPVSVIIEGHGFYRQVVVNGTCRVEPIEAGSYKLTLPSGAMTVDLRRDMTIRLDDRKQGGPPAVSWMPFAGAAMVSAAGIAVGLALIRQR